MARSTRGGTGAGQQQRQMAPGQAFRVPGMSTRSRILPEGGNRNVLTALTIDGQTPMPTVKFDQADIIKGYLAVVNFTGTYTPGEGDTIVPSVFAPANLLAAIKLQYEATYAPINLSGIMAMVMQNYRPVFSADDSSVGLLTQSTVTQTAFGTFGPTSGFPHNTGGGNNLLTPITGFGSEGELSGTYSFPLYIELPVSICFDLYWPINKDGSLANGAPLPRRIVSPQYMAATTRNNVPELTVGSPFTESTTNWERLALTSGTGAFSAGSTLLNMYRWGWFPGNRVATPPIDPWQYARVEMQWPTNGTSPVTIPLDSQEADQGQIMSLVGYVYDPALNDGAGGIVPLSSIANVALLYSSDVYVRNQTPAVNQYEWATLHGAILPDGTFGWDLALSPDGKLTNEELLNTYIQSGVQVRIDFNSGDQPSSSAQVYLGIESLKYVTQ